MRVDPAPAGSGGRPDACRVVIITLDNHLSGAIDRARARFARSDVPISIGFHAAADWDKDGKLEAARADIAGGDIVIVTMLFLDEQIRAIKDALEARREACDAMVCLMSQSDIVKMTRMGDYRMDAPPKGPLGWLKKLRGSSKDGAANSGAAQMAVLRRLPKLLKFVPGTAQDVRAYFLTLQYWLAGSDDNAFMMVQALVDRYADGPRKSLRGKTKVEAPQDYPEVGVYHPDLPQRMSTKVSDLPQGRNAVGTVGVVLLRSYVLGKDANHYDGVIRAMEAKGLNVIPAFAAGLDARPAIEELMMKDGVPTVDAIINLTGFSLVGGPAYSDAKSAEEILARMDRPYISAHPVEFQTLQQWGANRQGLLPLESTIMIAIPELDGGTQPMVFGGRSDASGEACTGCERGCTWTTTEGVRAMQSCPERAEAMAAKMLKLVALRKAPPVDRKIGIVLFNFPPNGGAAGTAQFLAVFESLHATLKRLKSEGYDVEVPENGDAVRERVIGGNAMKYGQEANVHDFVSADHIVATEPFLKQVEAEWGPAPGKFQSDGRSVFILGAQFGNVFIGIQPAIGYESDPMRLLFDGRFAPTHAFMAFYRWLRDGFGAHAVLHYGTHGSLEFMPGKQTGMTASCWPERLIQDLPNIYLYAANNPSEGVLAKRRSGATLVSYLTPALTNSGLYKGLADLKASVERWRATPPDSAELAPLAEIIAEQAQAMDLDGSDVSLLSTRLYEIERELIPQGLHVLGAAETEDARIDMLLATASTREDPLPRETIEGLVRGTVRPDTPLLRELASLNNALMTNHEMAGLIHALDGGYIRPVSGGDILRTPEILPTGRNIHGFDPFRLPSSFACKDGAAQATRIVARALQDSGRIPESIAMVLWGTDNLKSEGAQVAQALALMGARPRFDSYNRLSGAELIPLEQLGRPRIDVLITLSGVFRDLLPLQTRMMAEAALLASEADEPLEQNFVRAHSLAYQAEHGCDMATAALRVYSNAEGSYGANVNLLIDSGGWTDPAELADCYERQKGYAYGVKGDPVRHPGMLASALKTVDCAYQNLESVELGITTIDQYVDTLGGISRAITRAKGGQSATVYIGDQTQGSGKVRSLQEQVALETRTRTLNPVWIEGQLRYGYEGVRQVEAAVTTTMGWSATTGQVDSWVYARITETYVLDDAMRQRIAEMNPRAAAKIANRLIEAADRNYWQPDADTLAALYAATDAIEDQLEGISQAA
ncbi:magnesium chelatase subunit H [Sandarakinorhabdus sp.]|uniref:magnesium chelatase subunit H n=1 Tax=Sandarakinorhabdus sp. TaxID=1916663 RepID=UPI00286DFE5F|nr:magnesium chelatase subunit H [Sandarakinorhabdus sp.]